MPAAMLHLLTARCLLPEGDGRFLLGCIAPDSQHSREEKDAIHFRDCPERLQALQALAAQLPRGDGFALGWLLHLYTDLCWDDTAIAGFRRDWEGEDWFSAYRRESHRASFGLYHGEDWSEGAFRALCAAGAEPGSPLLQVRTEALEAYREKVFGKHRESDPASRSAYFPPELLQSFARETAEGFRRCFGSWLQPRESGSAQP